MQDIVRHVTRLLLLLMASMLLAAFAPYFLLAVTKDSIFYEFTHQYWIWKAAFGLIIAYLLRAEWRLAISIGLLSAIAPTFGAIFYLIVIYVKKFK